MLGRFGTFKEKCKEKMLYTVFICLIFTFSIQGKTSKEILTVSEVTDIIEKVNNHRQSVHTGNENAFWDNAAYHTGNMAAYEVTNNELYRAYSERWADYNQWKGARSDDDRGRTGRGV